MKLTIITLTLLAVISTATYAITSNPRTSEITNFATGHWHDEHGMTHDAIQHSGGTDAYGCHNGSVPYHCH